MCKPIAMALRNVVLQPHAHRKVGESFMLPRWPWSSEYIQHRILQKNTYEDGVMMLVEYRNWCLTDLTGTAGILWIGNFGQSGWVAISKDKEAKEWCELYRHISNEISLQAKYG